MRNPGRNPRSRAGELLHRGALLFVGVFLLGAAAFQRSLILWLLDLRGLPQGGDVAVAGIVGAASVVAALHPGVPGRFRKGVRAALGLGFGVAAWNLVSVFQAGLREVSLSWFPPVSGLLAWVFVRGACSTRGPGRGAEAPSLKDWGRVSAVALGLAAVFPLVLCFALGWTDYRRPVDVAVVFGARAYADGTPSEALSDRVRTACALHRNGRVAKLVFSGGPGDGAVHETESMRRMAVSLGVPDRDIEVDPDGWNTRRTVEFVRCRFPGRDRIVAVSEFYHLPRIRLAFQQEGMAVTTAPAQPRRLARCLPLYSLCREVAAFWTYLLRGPRADSSRIPC